MATVTSNELVSAAQAMQCGAISRLLERDRPIMAVVRVDDSLHDTIYAPSASYARQIANHAAVIGVPYRQSVTSPDKAHFFVPMFIRTFSCTAETGVLALDPFHSDETQNSIIGDKARMEFKRNASQDLDDFARGQHRAPTARAMIAMANMAIHGPGYFRDKTLDELSQLHLRKDIQPDQIFFGGLGKVSCLPLRATLEQQNIEVPNENIADEQRPDRLKHLPQNALIFTAIPNAPGIIRSEDVAPGTIVIDAGFGVKDGVVCGNVEPAALLREDIVVTPPRHGVGNMSTTYLFHHLLELVLAPDVMTELRLGTPGRVAA